MRTVTIKFELTDRQWEYLRLAKSEQPDPQRIKLLLLSRAASTLRREGELVMQEARQSVVTERGQDQPAAKPIHWKDLPPAKKPLLYKSKAKKPNHSDRSATAHPQWLDDENIRKLTEVSRGKEPEIE